MNRRECLLALTAASMPGASAAAGPFPERPITLTSGYAPGGSTDISARLLADGMTSRLGANARVLVENRPGASGTVACEWMRRQPPDGYGLLLSESSSFAIWPSMHAEGTKYDPLRDFTWVGAVCTSPMVLIVSPDFPGKTLAEAIDVLRSPRSDALDYSSSGVGSIPHIAAELFRSILGPGNRSRHIAYRGGGPAALSISKSETAWSIATLGSAAGLVGGGLARPLAMTSAARFPAFPDVPTFTEAGLKDMEVEVFYLIHGPAGLPAPILRTLNEAAAAALASSTTTSRFLTAGMQAWTKENTPERTRAIVETELRRFRAVAERTGIKISG